MKKANKFISLFIFVLLVCFFNFSCSKKSDSSFIQTEEVAEVVADNFATSSAKMMVQKESSASSFSSTDSTLSNNLKDRKLILTGDIRFEVQSLAETRPIVEKWAEQFGGYISNSSENDNTLTFTAHIPSDKFTDAMNTSSSIGKIISKSMNSTDVTEYFYDLDTRLSTRRILLDRLKTYLQEAKNISDMIEIETKINDVTSELERMQGQFNRLSKQIDFSEIYVEATLPNNYSEERGFIFPDMKGAIITFFQNILAFFSNFIFIVLYIIIFGTPIVCFALILYWICFGKVGLIRRIFQKIKQSKNDK